MRINLRQEIAMWVLGLLWTALCISGIAAANSDVNALVIFLPIPIVLLVPIGLIVFSLRERKKAGA